DRFVLLGRNDRGDQGRRHRGVDYGVGLRLVTLVTGAGFDRQLVARILQQDVAESDRRDFLPPVRREVVVVVARGADQIGARIEFVTHRTAQVVMIGGGFVAVAFTDRDAV